MAATHSLTATLCFGILAATILSAAAHTSLHERQMLDWVRRQGGELKVTISRNAFGMRSLYTTQEVKSGDTLVKIPDHLVLSMPGIETPVEASPFLLKELYNPNSPYSPYLATLPSESEELSGFTFPEDYIPYLADPMLEEQVRNQYKKSVQEVLEGQRDDKLSMTVSQAVGAANISLPYLEYVSSLTATRAFTLEPKRTGLVPVLDMLNHDARDYTRVDFGDGTSVKLLATKDFAANEEVTLTYGPLHADETLLYYGFVDPQADPTRLLAVDIRSYDYHAHKAAPPLTGPIEEVRDEVERLQGILEYFEARLEQLGPIPEYNPQVAEQLRRLHAQRRSSLHHELTRLRDIVFRANRSEL